MSIQGFSIARRIDSLTLFAQPTVGTSSDLDFLSLLEEHVSRFFTNKKLSKAESTKLYEENRTLSFPSELGCFYSYIDDQGIIYSTFTQGHYPFNLARTALNKIKRELKNMPEYASQSKSSICRFAQGFIVDIIQEFNSKKVIEEELMKQKQINIDEVELQLQDEHNFISSGSSHPSNFSTTDQKHCLIEIDHLKQELKVQNQISEPDCALKEQQALKETVATKLENLKSGEKLRQDQAKVELVFRNLKIKIIVFIVLLAVVLYIVVPLL